MMRRLELAARGPAGRRCRPAARAGACTSPCAVRSARARRPARARSPAEFSIDRTPSGRRRARQAEAVLQRVQVARARVVHAAVEARAGDPARHVGRRDRGAARSRSRCSHALVPACSSRALARADRQAQVAVAPVAVDAEARRALARSGRSPRASCPRRARASSRPSCCFDRRLVAGQAVDRLAAVAARWRPSRPRALRAARPQKPRSASSIAADRPASPPPTIATSQSTCALQRGKALLARRRGGVVGVARQFAVGARAGT